LLAEAMLENEVTKEALELTRFHGQFRGS
jgi:hypothetical protein